MKMRFALVGANHLRKTYVSFFSSDAAMFISSASTINFSISL